MKHTIETGCALVIALAALTLAASILAVVGMALSL